MEFIATIGLVGNIIQFVDFIGVLISKSAQFYNSSNGAIAENNDIETATYHLILLNNDLKDATASTSDGALESLCKSCNNIAEELLAVLDNVKIKGEVGKWKSIRTAIRSAWRKEDIEGLERRLTRCREELNLHIVADLRDQVSRFRLEQSDHLQDLDLMTRKVIDAIVEEQDVFQAAHDMQLALMTSLHGETVARITNEHEITRREILQEIRRAGSQPGIVFLHGNLPVHQPGMVNQAKPQSVMEPEIGRTMRLLSLDSGGIRGLSSLYILENMMHKIKLMEDLDTEPLPCNYFDMICGTGTGGIIAIMLGRLRMSISECIATYLEMSQKVFAQPQKLTRQEKKFNPNTLEEVIKAVIKSKTGDENSPLLDSSSCKTFVCTSELKAVGGSLVLLRTYETSTAPISCTIWEAARATSALPKFFPSIRISKHPCREFISAGTGRNNPTKILIKEAKSYYSLKGYRATRPTCLVSIGTGQKDLIQLHKAASVFWLKQATGLSIAPALGEIVTDCENTHDEVMLSSLEDGVTNTYYRFNVPHGVQNIVLNEWAKADDIRTYTEKYMRLKQTEEELLECIKRFRFGGDAPPLGSNERNIPEKPRALLINQEGSEFRGHNVVNGGSIFQGNFTSFRPHLFDETICL